MKPSVQEMLDRAMKAVGLVPVRVNGAGAAERKAKRAATRSRRQRKLARLVTRAKP